jgi:hypothetical protein
MPKMECGVDVNAQGGRYETPFEEVHTSVVILPVLLDNGPMSTL